MYHDYPWIIRTSSVVAIPVIQKYNVSMDYPFDIQCGSHPSNSEIQCIHGLSMDLPTSNVVAHSVSMDYPRLSMDHPTSKVVAMHPSNSEIQCIHGFSGRVQHQVCYCSNPSNSGIQCMIIHGSTQRWTLTHSKNKGVIFTPKLE